MDSLHGDWKVYLIYFITSCHSFQAAYENPSGFYPEGLVIAMSFGRKLEIQLHLTESQPGQADANGKPDDGADEGPQLEGILNGIGDQHIDAAVMEVMIQLQTLHEFRGQADQGTHSKSQQAGNHDEIANETENHVLGAENQRHQQGDGASDQQNGAKTSGQKVAKLLNIQVDASNDGQNAQHTTGDQKVGQHHQCQLNHLGNDNLQTGNTKAKSYLNGLGTEVKGKGLVEGHDADKEFDPDFEEGRGGIHHRNGSEIACSLIPAVENMKHEYCFKKDQEDYAGDTGGNTLVVSANIIKHYALPPTRPK